MKSSSGMMLWLIGLVTLLMKTNTCYGSNTMGVRLSTPPKFKGEQGKFNIWWTQMYAFAGVVGFSAALKPTKLTNLPDEEHKEIDETVDDGKKAKRALNIHNMAMAMLSLSFDSEKLINIINKSRTKEWPGGLAHVVVSELFKLFKPQDLMARIEMRSALDKLKMKASQSPDSFYDEYVCVMAQYTDVDERDKLSEAEKIAWLQNKIHPQYLTTLVQEYRRLGDKYTIEAGIQAAQVLYRAAGGKVNGFNEASGEVSLFSGDKNEKKRDVICFTCGEKGHKSFECPNKDSSDKKSSRKGKSSVKCENCGKTGHKTKDCWLKEENKDKVPKWYKVPEKKVEETTETNLQSTDTDSNSGVEVLLASVDKYIEEIDMDIQTGKYETALEQLVQNQQTLETLLDPDIWIADTGASTMSTGSALGGVNKRSSDAQIQNTNSTTCASAVVDIPVLMCDKTGKSRGRAKLQDVIVVPGQKYNLFSITRLCCNGWKLGNDNESLWLTKDGREILFDIKVPTKRGFILAGKLQRNPPEVNAVSVAKKKTITLKEAHEMLGHMNNDATKQTIEALGYSITDTTMPVCESCAVGKAKQKDVPKVSKGIKASEAGERVFMDISSVKAKKNGYPINANKHWVMTVDELTGMKFSSFYKTKDGMVEPTLEQWQKWKQDGIKIKHVRSDNAGENKTLRDRAQSVDWKLNIKWEYTSRNTPQQNSPVEVGFHTIANRARAMMHQANVPVSIRYKIYPKVLTCATKLDGLVMIDVNGKTKSRYEHFFGSRPKFSEHIRTWGEAGTVTTYIKTNKPKVMDRGVTCMFVGYPDEH